MILQTICCTGIRVSELCFVTVKAVRLGYAEVCCKGKNRRIMIPGNLRKKLLIYIQKNGIEKGEVFITKTGNAMDRSNIWRGMKRLAAEAGVLADKIFPHNLRHLFARSFYEIDKDIACLLYTSLLQTDCLWPGNGLYRPGVSDRGRRDEIYPLHRSDPSPDELRRKLCVQHIYSVRSHAGAVYFKTE